MICDLKMVPPLSMWPTLWNKMAFSRPEGFQTGVKRLEGSHKGVLERSMKKMSKRITYRSLCFLQNYKIFNIQQINKLKFKKGNITESVLLKAG